MKNKPAASQHHVLLVGPVPPPYGGIPTYVKSLLDANIEGVDYTLFNTAFPENVASFHREGKRSYTSLLENGVLVGLKKVAYVLWSLVLLAITITRQQPAIVHVFTCSYWGYWRNWVYILVAKLFRRKTIFHLLGAIDLFYEEVGGFQKAILRRSLNSADCYLMQSPGLEAWAKQYSRRRVMGLWNGIDFQQIPPKEELPPDFIRQSAGLVGVTIGSLGTNKGTPEILEVVRRLQEQNDPAGWVLIGRGDAGYFRSLAESYGISKWVLFTGEIDESVKWRYLHHAAFYCLPSRAEGQPISILEAMAAGLPIISTAVGSIPEVITEGCEGFVVPPVDAGLLEDRVRRLVQNPGLRSEMGKNALLTVRARHDIQQLYQHIFQIYQSLAGKERDR